MSIIYTVEHEDDSYQMCNRPELLKKVSSLADRLGSQYIRIAPNCLLDDNDLIRHHMSLDAILQTIDDSRFFHQYKVHNLPQASVCHQSYFRPYLSEEPWHEDGEPGSVYPCDSVVLNDTSTFFSTKYQICKPENILDFLDKKINVNFVPNKDCHSCVFANTVNDLNRWVRGEMEIPAIEKIEHAEFI